MPKYTSKKNKSGRTLHDKVKLWDVFETEVGDKSKGTSSLECIYRECGDRAVSYTHLRAHETLMNLVCRLLLEKTFFFLMIRRPPRSTRKESSAASDVYKRQRHTGTCRV